MIPVRLTARFTTWDEMQAFIRRAHEQSCVAAATSDNDPVAHIQISKPPSEAEFRALDDLFRAYGQDLTQLHALRPYPLA
jgi:hypothetical protein